MARRLRPTEERVAKRFGRLRESELVRLSDEDLVEYIRDAADAGESRVAQTAIGILSAGYLPIVRARVGLRLPRDEVDDVASLVLASALSSIFSGSSVGEFRSWLNTIC